VNKKRAADDVDPPSALASKKHAAYDVDATAINSSDEDGLFAEDDAISTIPRKSNPKRSNNVRDSEPAVTAFRETDDEDIEVTNIECTEPHFLRGDIPWILHPCRGSSRSAVYSFCSAITFIGMEALSLKIMLGANNLNLMTNPPRNQAAERPGHTLLSQFMNLFAGSLAPHWVLVRAMDSFDPSLHFHPFPVLIITNADELAGFTIYGEWIFVACEKDAIRFSPKRVTDCGYNAQNRRVYLLEPKKESPHSGSGPNESSSARVTNLNSSGVRPPNRRGSGGSHATGTPMPTANESSYWPTHHPSPATTWSMHPPRA
jgi:hypothetical protein